MVIDLGNHKEPWRVLEGDRAAIPFQYPPWLFVIAWIDHHSDSASD